MQAHRKCSVSQLATLEQISKESAQKASNHYQNGYSIVPVGRQRGHGQSGVGSLVGLSAWHHAFIYELYTSNPARPLCGYVEGLYRKYQMIVSKQLVLRWFKFIGPNTGSMRETLAYPPGRSMNQLCIIYPSTLGLYPGSMMSVVWSLQMRSQ